MVDTGLTAAQLDFFCTKLAPYADAIDYVRVFGSRATGLYKLTSDIDLVVYGPISQTAIDRLWTLFEESPLPFRVDIVAYALITHSGLRGHIDQAAKPFLTKEDLIAAKTSAQPAFLPGGETF
jgi:uncharacterized protein